MKLFNILKNMTTMPIKVDQLTGYQKQSSASAATLTFNVARGTYLIAVSRINGSGAATNGLYISQMHSTNSTVSTILESNSCTVSVSHLVITAVTSVTNMAVMVFPLRLA